MAVMIAMPARPVPIRRPMPATGTPACVSAIARTTPASPTADDRRKAAR
jgi:hypothetical protein